MKRDFDLIRQLLFKLEKSNSEWAHIKNLSDDDKYQVRLMFEAGLIALNSYGGELRTHKTSAVNEHDFGMFSAADFTLTWEGHDYLDAIRAESVWERTKAVVAETGGSATFEIVKTLATGLLRKQISKHTGIEL